MDTQTVHPWRAAARTFFAYLVVALPAYAIGVPILLEEVGDFLPPGAVTWLTASAVFVGGLVAAITRIMAIPSVNEALGNVGLSASPSGGSNDRGAANQVLNRRIN